MALTNDAAGFSVDDVIKSIPPSLLKSVYVELKKKFEHVDEKSSREIEDKLEIVLEYTSKTFIIVGNTKKYKDLLKTLGGFYNSKFKYNGGTSGWGFSTGKLDEVKSILNSNKIPYTEHIK